MSNKLILLTIFIASIIAVHAAQKPNIIIIFTDDQGYQDLSCFGSPKIKTPNIDKMADEGVKFTDFYVSCNKCTPSRLSLLTGAYPQRMGWKSGVLFPRHKKGLLKPEFYTMPELMKDAGYATACIGKWHLGHANKYLPTAHGFDYYYGIPFSNDMTGWEGMHFSADANFREGMTREKHDYKKKNRVPLMRGTEVIEFPADQSTLTQRYTKESIDFITKNKGTSFFLYLAHSMPHTPLYPNKNFAGKSDRGPYGDVIEEIDWSTGAILKALKENGIDENTLVIFTSDNGPWLTKGDAGGSALPLRNGKGTTWEGGPRVPAVMRWPAGIPAGKECNEVATTMDLLPTFAKLTGATLPEYTIDGNDITKLLTNPESKSPTQYYFYITAKGAAAGVRSGKWKLHGDALFNLEDDISETKDVAAAYPELAQRLKVKLQQFATETHIQVGVSKPKGKKKKARANK